ncbi:MAG: NgoFVII family restriction endonuclease [Intestinibacter bartlettii]|uniref:restriction endonuclease PLD domain-containing protein n=1 Tax=Intestinibacter bartlettii TaxID=261299 RepID=UPI002432E468|nr:restriction endonuclease PLD domain-containing protein [Intestinibacter bartlettii]MBS7148155.1 NgoFVII family restriction endonuclease [Intestinibacter bartlettii]
MLFNNNLEEIIFNRHHHILCDELIIISGYVGPSPIARLSTLPINTTVIYGMYGSQSISPRLHNTLVQLNNASNNTTILYSQIPVHSKCYIWRYQENIVSALVGSANFSTSGLTIPFRETLAETTSDTFSPLNEYAQQIINNSLLCTDVFINQPTTVPTVASNHINYPVQGSVCSMILYDPRSGDVPIGSGLNWGHSPNGHNSPNVAYIPIRTEHIRNYPNLFPPKQLTPTSTTGGRPQRQNDSIEIIWDDGTIMQGLLEGSQPVDGIQYPKNLSSFPTKDIIGVYLRHRLGLMPNSIVTRDDLSRYGRDNISVSLLENGTYYLDFSV